MGTYAMLNFAVRRGDLSPVMGDDFVAVEKFFETYFANGWSVENPYISHDGMQIHASCEVRWGLSPSEVAPFAKNNPHLQIEVYENVDSDEVDVTRDLFEGNTFEILSTISVLEEPQKIDWPSHNAGREYELGKQLRALKENKKFAHFIGHMVRKEFLESPYTDWHLGEEILSAYLGGRLDELLLAVSSMDMEDMLSAWEESQTHQEVTE